MKRLFEHASTSWVRYSGYETRWDSRGREYIAPSPNAKPQIYNPMDDHRTIVLDALNVGLRMEKRNAQKRRRAVMGFVGKYGLLGLMTALPTTPKFVEYEAVYLPTNPFLREEVMETEQYMDNFFPLEKPNFAKRGRESMWFVGEKRMMLALP